MERCFWRAYSSRHPDVKETRMFDDPPTPEAIRAARTNAGLTQLRAAVLMNTTPRTWQRWESGGGPMHPALWELFQSRCAERVAGKRE